MNQTFRALAAVGIIIIVIAGSALFVINRTRQQQLAQATPTPGPLLGTPAPTFVPFGSSTPFPLITFGTGSPTPIATSSATPRPTTSAIPSGSPVATYACQYLTAQPAEGTAPLNVRFTAAGFGSTSSTIREYEFNFGDGSATVRQAGTSATHRYTSSGNFVASLRIRDNQGNIIAIPGGECRRSIIVRGAPTPAGTSTSSGQLPKTGPEEWLWIISLPVIGLGFYLYKRFRLI